MAKKNFFCAIDIGSYSIKGILASKEKGKNNLEILNCEQISSFGVRHGEIFKPEVVEEKLITLKKIFEEKSGSKMSQIFLNVSGPNLSIEETKTSLTITKPNRIISQEEIDKILGEIENFNFFANKEVLEILTKEFILDGKTGIKNPLNLEGQRLEVNCKVVCCFKPILNNVEKLFSNENLEIQIIPTPLASVRSILSPEDAEIGTIIIDLGAGQTTISFVKEGELFHFLTIPNGLSEITNELAIILRTDIKTAEEIKKEYSDLSLRDNIKNNKKTKEKDKIFVSEKSLLFSKKTIQKITQNHLERIFNTLQKEIKKVSKNNNFPGGIILTGGGAKIPGILPFTKSYFKLPVRIGKNFDFYHDLDIEYLNCLGILLKGIDSLEEEKEVKNIGIFRKIKKFIAPFLP
jgi:cell division protein FtsA